jgi:soluble lytic murein transglycosylase
MAGAHAQNAESRSSHAVPRLPVLLAVSCLGSGAALLAGRALLAQRAPLTPTAATASLERIQRWAPDPEQRREASLLLAARAPASEEPARQRQLLRAQGWGPGPLAALVLKQQALAVTADAGPEAALPLWRQLLHRFPQDTASADALYALGRQAPGLHRQLLERFPAHPAALAAALEAGPEPAQRLAGSLHLARWGPRWPGAQERLRALCPADGAPPPSRLREPIAAGLAELGDGAAALRCLGNEGAATRLPAPTRLTLARSLLRGDEAQRRRGEALLVSLAAGEGPQAEAAVRLLSEQEGADADAALRQLPARWQDTPELAARRALTAPDPVPQALQVLRRWPDDPASHELQWSLARKLLLAGRWQQAHDLLAAIPARQLPPALAARQRFWLGYSERQLGDAEAASTTWRQLLQAHPGGYYGWRAAVQLGQAPAQPASGLAAAPPGDGWQPLASGDPRLDHLWRLDQRTEAWETWRHRRQAERPEQATDLLVEGRLRQGVGDDWTGFGQLDLAALRLQPDQCALQVQLERSQHPPRHMEAFRTAAQAHQVPLALLLGVSRQESRFTPAVRSSVGAVGLMQLMPETAAELAGGPLSGASLEDPQRNTDLGSRYLGQLLDQWQGDPLLAVASYNAGPGAVAGWVSPQLRSAPELWVEAIPYPETRLYVKKVLGNAWSFQQPRLPEC